MLDLVVHATHEAGVKVGGIGAVLDGLLGSRAYNEAIGRTILLGPYDANDSLEQERLRAPRNGLTIRYHTRDGISTISERLALAFHNIQQFHQVSLLYGTRRFGQIEHEVLLVDASRAQAGPINDLKAWLYEHHGFHSERYEGEPEYDQSMGGAVAGVNALQALLQEGEAGRGYFMAHEWLGLPALFAAQRHLPGQFANIFYAHETATVRAIVEGHPGHDLRFYNAMRMGLAQGLSMEQLFGSYQYFFKHAFIRAALSLEGIFAVGDLVKEELVFLEPAIQQRVVDLVYNGVPSREIGVEEKLASKRLLQQYAENLYGFQPDWVFTHVTRMVPSKGLWRDLRVMEQLDQRLAARGEQAIYYLLSSVRPAGRRSEDVHRWEAEYGWPVHHRADNGDLIAYEWDYYQAFEAFNHSARASRMVLVNQFGWSRDRCGMRMPEEMQFNDLRWGADVEFGQSTYEPFGIAQVEPLSFGAICAISTACGCVGFVSDAGGLDLDNVVVADYLHLPPEAGFNDLPRVLNIGRSERDMIEGYVAGEVAETLMERLPRDEETLTRRLQDGYDLSTKMSWEVVTRDYLLPALARLAP